jgi:phytoene dehydrogenase-like protein
LADHVIVGTGINALVAGALLARKGKRVILLEREERIGGCMMTDDVTLPGFHHDIMAATFVLFLTSPAYAELAQELEAHGFELCHTPHPTAVLRPGGKAVILTTDRAKNIKKFNAIRPGDGDQHERDVSGVEQDAEFLFNLLGGNIWSWRTSRYLFWRVLKRGLNGMKAWFGDALLPARHWLETGYRSEDIQALYAPWVLHAGLTPEAPYSGQIGKVIAFALEAAGAPVMKGGAGRAAMAFKALIEAHGGEIRTGCDVDEIIVKNGRAIGVRTAKGEEITAKHVLASVTPSQLYGRLIQDAPAKDVAASKAYRHGRGNFQLHYALKSPPKWVTGGLDDVALIHLSDGIDAVSKSANEAERGLFPETPTLCVGQPHRLDASRCPSGQAVLWVQVPDAPRVIKGDSIGKIRGTAWSPATREAFADRIEGILARHIKNFAKIKLDRKAYSPVDLEALNMNLVTGDPYGGQCGINQFFAFRPFTDSVNNETSIKNLHHIGASTHPGPGLAGGSGFNTAKRLGA